MRKIYKVMMFFMAMGILQSCGNENVTEELTEDIDALETRIDALEKMHEQVKAIKDLLDSSNTENCIVSIENVYDGDKLVGYKINFLNREPVILYTYVDSSEPQIAVVEVDGVLYWQINGSILEYEGKKVAVSYGNPEFRFQDGEWQVSFNNSDWEAIPVIYGNPVMDIKLDTTSSDYVLFYINGERVEIPWYKPLEIEFKYGNIIINDDSDNVVIDRINGATEFNISYNVSGFKSEDKPEIKVYAQDGYTVDYNYVISSKPGESDNRSLTGTITAKSPDGEFHLGRLVVLVSDGKQRTIKRELVIKDSETDGTIISVAQNDIEVPAGVGVKEIKVTSDVPIANLKVEVPNGIDWISVNSESQIKALSRTVSQDITLKLNIALNGNYYSRVAEITIFDNSTYTIVEPIKIRITQSANIVTIKNLTAGGLKTALEGKNPTEIIALKLSGKIDRGNGGDFAYLKELATTGKLKWMDISGTTICSDGKTSAQIPSNAFEGTNLEYIYLPDNISHIHQSAFRGSKLIKIELPSKLATIEPYAFFGCPELTEVTILSNTKIHNCSFRDCPKLKAVKINLASPPPYEDVKSDDLATAPFGVYNKETGELTKVPELYTLTDSGPNFAGWWELYFDKILPNMY